MQQILTEFDLGWVVGILEGEGCFGTYEDKRRTQQIDKVLLNCEYKRNKQ
jgi:hypothetical protein